MLWSLCGGQVMTPLPTLPVLGRPWGLGYCDEDVAAWLTLHDSIRARRHARTEAALRQLLQAQMAFDEECCPEGRTVPAGVPRWRWHHRAYYPDFQPILLALFAVARHHGFEPHALSDDERAYFGASR